jgi:hypothetical protein
MNEAGRVMRPAATRVALGIDAHMGWAAVSVIARSQHAIRVIRTERIDTADSGDREALEPYHVAAGFDGIERMPRPSDAAAILARGLARQRRHTLASCRKLCSELRDSGHDVTNAAILSGRGRMSASLDNLLASHAQIHIAEGIAVRESIATALVELGLTVEPIDKQSLYDRAARILGMSCDEIAAALKAARPENLGAWRQDQKLAALAAWCVANKPARA